jgi:hypothetical protein
MGAPIPQHLCHFPARMLEFLEIAAYMAVRMRARPYATSRIDVCAAWSSHPSMPRCKPQRTTPTVT